MENTGLPRAWPSRPVAPPLETLTDAATQSAPRLATAGRFRLISLPTGRQARVRQGLLSLFHRRAMLIPGPTFQNLMLGLSGL